MTRFFAYIIILLVLFTHSTMAMDVHIPQETKHSSEQESRLSTNPIDIDQTQAVCVDAGGHCSHHQAHTAGLLSVSLLSDGGHQETIFPTISIFALIHTQSPPRRPPK